MIMSTVDLKGWSHRVKKSHDHYRTLLVNVGSHVCIHCTCTFTVYFKFGITGGDIIKYTVPRDAYVCTTLCLATARSRIVLEIRVVLGMLPK